MVTREQVFSITLATEEVEVPKLGTLTVREFTQDEYADWVAEWDTLEKPQRRRVYCASLIRRGVLNGNGEALFTMEDMDKLAQLPPRVARPLIRALERLNGIDEVTAVRDAKKNSDSGQDGEISTSSPATTSGSGT